LLGLDLFTQSLHLLLIFEVLCRFCAAVEAKYPALLFKQQLTTFLEKIYGLIRDNLKKEISLLIGSCIQVSRTSRAIFFNNLPSGSVIFDARCGNGKYLGLNPDYVFIGCDISAPLIQICNDRGHEVLVADAVNLPYF
ncbi:hypothetical protein Ccrd_013477, partial [Cynara cardunculus var. scolymus]